MKMRLQKYLAMCGVCSRRHAEELIIEGRVRVNNISVRELGVKIDPEKDVVAVGKRVLRRNDRRVYVAVNKPKGVITSCSGEQGMNITALVKVPERVYPAGRLDKDSTGLVLLTNDGELAERLMHPRYAHEKEYVVEHSPPLEGWAYGRLARGVRLAKMTTQPAEVKRETAHRFRIVLREGRYHQVRRMCEALGTKVTMLKRVRIGPLRLGRLAPGEWRRLTGAEVKALREAVGLGGGEGSKNAEQKKCEVRRGESERRGNGE